MSQKVAQVEMTNLLVVQSSPFLKQNHIKTKMFMELKSNHVWLTFEQYKTKDPWLLQSAGAFIQSLTMFTQMVWEITVTIPSMQPPAPFLSAILCIQQICWIAARKY